MSNSDKNDWAAFGRRLIDERRKEKPTSVASSGFVDRMTSSTAAPDAAAREQGDSNPKPPEA